ncbi:MAG: hypothetical protein J6Z45_01025 [Oscillospiraceae bacterium]|nr:hypothetical protein [Oscillospiraceae bacterium]
MRIRTSRQILLRLCFSSGPDFTPYTVVSDLLQERGGNNDGEHAGGELSHSNEEEKENQAQAIFFC